MKAILMSIRPEWVAKILNGEKTIEIRKKFPKDYVGWVYIYCTKEKPYVRRYVHNDKWGTLEYIKIDGKVVARFWCDKVEEIKLISLFEPRYATETMGDSSLLINSCLSREDMNDYLRCKNGYAIHITEVKPFDEPKDISEFWNKRERMFVNGKMLYDHKFHLTRAPQSWCFIEIGE